MDNTQKYGWPHLLVDAGENRLRGTWVLAWGCEGGRFVEVCIESGCVFLGGAPRIHLGSHYLLWVWVSLEAPLDGSHLHSYECCGHAGSVNMRRSTRH